MHSSLLTSVQNTTKQKSSPRQGVILLFDTKKQRKKTLQRCIFCDTTFPLQSFKGKTVCSKCLQNIPELFSIPTHYVT